jgi:hypothetical protein
MATIEDEIAGIREAIASGALRVKFQDGNVMKETEFGSFDDLKKRLDFLLNDQSNAAGPVARPRLSLASFGRG